MSEETQQAQSPIPIVTTMLVDDHAIWRGGMHALLEDTEFTIVGEASSGREALVIARQVNPQLVLLDIRMAGGNGLDVLMALKQEHPRMAVIMLTTYDDPTYMARAIAGGAAGYILKGAERDTMLQSMRAVANGDTLLARNDFVSSLRGITKTAAESPELNRPFSAREEEVLRLLAMGLPNREIASLLSIAEGTARTHVIHIIAKLDVSDRVQAAVWAARHGLGPE